MYVDYDYYKNSYGGTMVDQLSFDSYELRARTWLNGYVRPNRIDKVLHSIQADNVKIAMCELIDNIKSYDTHLNGATEGENVFYKGISSESVKDHTVSFKTDGKGMVQSLKDNTEGQALAIVHQYLQLTGLLYRGF